MRREIMAAFFSENILHIADSTVQNNINFHKLLIIREWMGQKYFWVGYFWEHLFAWLNFFACIKNFASVNFFSGSNFLRRSKIFCLSQFFFVWVQNLLRGSKILPTKIMVDAFPIYFHWLLNPHGGCVFFAHASTSTFCLIMR